mmetsp:Transcript_62485/g.152122  ORF Transcript_62485/g.152122 Transcript_62485/m.152122 type:complete len:264 (+) Transcript_62485:213-1004(+)
MTDNATPPKEQAAAPETAPSSSSQPEVSTTATGAGGRVASGSSGGRGRGVGGGNGGRGQQQRSSGRNQQNSGRGRGRGRGGGGDGPASSSSNQQQQRPQGVTVAPTTGIPFGHVPAYLPGSSSLVEDLDQRIMVVLRDGRHLLGTFRSFDQFSNMVLDDACERKMHVDLSDGITYYADIPLGLYVVRGDSVVLLGQIGDGKFDEDPSLNDKMKSSMKMIDLDELEGKIASASGDKQQAVSPSPAQGDDKGHVLEWDFDKDLVA